MLVPRPVPEFRARCEGAYVAGRTWLYFAFDASLFGFVLWDSPSGAEMTEFINLLELELDRAPHAVFADVSRVTSFSPEAYAALSGYVAEHAEALAGIVTASAIVRPQGGLNGAIATGFFGPVSAPFRVTIHDDAASGLGALGAKDPSGLAAALAEAHAAASGVPVLLRAARLYLATHLVEPTLEEAAKAAGVSARTLQRRLGELGTSFVDEVQEARVRAAERMLLDSADPLTTIAFAVGCASPQHFSALFRKLRGQTPSDYRKHRGSAP